MQCRLRHADPPCKWAGLLVQLDSKGTVELRTCAETCEHNRSSPLCGKRGLDSLAAAQHIARLYESLPEAKPKAVLDDVRKKFPGQTLNLRAVQGRKCPHRSCTKLGELAVAIRDYIKQPPPECKHVPFFVQHDLKRVAGKARVTLICSTHDLMSRWALDCGSCATDGGFKFCCTGWPLTLLGRMTETGKFNLDALILTSTSDADHIEEAFESWAGHVNERVPGRAGKPWGMSDAADGYRRGLKQAFGAKNKMCWFHVVHAVRAWIYQKCPGSADDKKINLGFGA